MQHEKQVIQNLQREVSDLKERLKDQEQTIPDMMDSINTLFRPEGTHNPDVLYSECLY